VEKKVVSDGILCSTLLSRRGCIIYMKNGSNDVLQSSQKALGLTQAEINSYLLKEHLGVACLFWQM